MNNLNKIGVTIIFFLFTSFFYSQTNSTCQNAILFSPNPMVPYPAGVNSGNAQNGPNYGCLGSQPNPAWYYLQISGSGSLVLTFSGSGSQDIDYVAYGPFNSLSSICNSLTANKIIGCSFSGSPSETLTISNALAGEYYMMMITNYSNYSQNIIFTQQAGNGTLAGNYLNLTCSPLCPGISATLTSNSYNLSNASFSLNPGGFTSSTPTFVINPFVTTNYTLVCTGVNSQSVTQTVSSTFSVVANDSPTLAATIVSPTICAGSSASIIVSGALTYTWSNGLSTADSVAVVSPSTSTIYSVIGTSSGGCTDSLQITQYVESCTGLLPAEITSQKLLNLFPNPAGNTLSIRCNSFKNNDVVSMIIYGITGEMIHTDTIQFLNDESYINTQALFSGMYLLVFKNNVSVITKRFTVLK